MPPRNADGTDPKASRGGLWFWTFMLATALLAAAVVLLGGIGF